MPRIRLKALDSYDFSLTLTVRTTDLNYGGHLGNDRLLSLIHEARVAFLAAHHWTELDIAGVSLIQGDAAILYQGEAYAGDVLRIDVQAGEPGRSGFRLFYRIIRERDDAPIALVETGLVCYDYQSRSIRPLPAAVRTLTDGDQR